MSKYNLISILGPTAGGKTTVAANLAIRLGAEIISADSRQVYKGMDIGTGKDIADYTVSGEQVPYHLIDVLKAGEKYNLYRFQHDFKTAFTEIAQRNKLPIMCGGTGLYLESILKAYKIPDVPENAALRESLQNKTHNELIDRLKNLQALHNTTDTESRKRLIRAIEIAVFIKENPESGHSDFPETNSLTVGIRYERPAQRERITQRLHQRLHEGMVDEVSGLLDSGVSVETMLFYGLEYKFITQHITGQLSYKQMVEKLNIAIHQFAKRQMTWFRGMERRGVPIKWLAGEMPIDEKLDQILEWYKSNS